MRVPKTGLEPAHLATHAPETCASTNSATWASSALQFLVCSINGAENGTRTRDPNLGKVVLYQLSYFRIFLLSLVLVRSSLDKHFSKCDAKVRLFSETAKLFPIFFHQNPHFLALVDLNQPPIHLFHNNHAIFEKISQISSSTLFTAF